jgi:hypothetical protein
LGWVWSGGSHSEDKAGEIWGENEVQVLSESKRTACQVSES